MSVDIDQSLNTIPPGIRREGAFAEDKQPVPSLRQYPGFNNPFWSDPSCCQTLTCSNCPIHVELSKLRCENAYWRKMHQKAVERETKLKEEIAESR